MELGKCLVITHPARLGDSALSLPLHRALASRGEVHSNVGEPYRFLFELAGIEVAQAGPLYPKGATALLREAGALRTRGFDTAFLVRPNFRSALLARLAGIRIRVGDATEGRGPLLSHKADVPPKANQLVRLQAFGNAVGLEVPLEFGLPTSAKAVPPVFGIVPGASYEDKFIPRPALRDVAERLLDRGLKLALLGGPGEEPWAEFLNDLPAENWVGKFSLPDLISPLGSLCGLLASDGGLYHLSVACGVPSVGVYGPTASKNWWHAWGPHVPVLAPQGKMEAVDADMLWQAVTRVLENAGYGAGTEPFTSG